MRGRTRDFPSTPCPPPGHSLPLYQHPPPEWNACCNRWTYTDTSSSPKVHSLHPGSLLVLCILCGSGRMQKDRHPPSQHHAECFPCPKCPLCSARSSPPIPPVPPNPGQPDLFTVPIVWSLPECHMLESHVALQTCFYHFVMCRDVSSRSFVA